MAQQFPSALNPRVGPVDLEFSTYDAAVAAGQDAFATNPLQSALSYFDLRAARKDEDAIALSLSEQSLIIEDAGLIDVLKPEEGETDRSLNMLIDMKREELARQTVMANAREGITSSAAMLGSGLFASLLDPINAAVGFVPLVGPARYAAMLQQRATTLGRFSVRAKVGAAEGAVATAAVEPLVYFTAQDRQADYTVYDTFANLAFGTVLGGGLVGVGGYFKDRLSPTVTQRQVAQAIDNATPEARQSAFNSAIGQLANGRSVQGVDYILRADLENSTAVGRFMDSDTELDAQQAIQSARETLGPLVLGEDAQPSFAVRAAAGLRNAGAARAETDKLQAAGVDATTRQADDGSFEVDMVLPSDLVVRQPNGIYMSYRNKKTANKARTRLKKEGVIEDGTAVKIGDEYFIVKTTDKTITDAISRNSDSITLPTEFAAVQLSRTITQATGAPRVVPDMDYALDAVMRSHAPENRVFAAQERTVLETVEQDSARLFDDLDEATARQETENELAEIELLKTELADDPLLASIVNEAEAELRAVDDLIGSTRQTSDGFRQAAACVLQGVA